MGKLFWAKAALTAGVAVTSLFLMQGKPASALTAYTIGYVSDEDVSTEWKWDTTDGARLYGYQKLINVNTWDAVPGGWHLVDGFWYYFENGGYVFDQFHNGYYIGTAPNGVYYETSTPVIYHWEKDSKGWKYVTDHLFQEWEDTELKELHDDIYRIDGKIYAFDKDGYMLTAGWQKNDSSDWVYAEKDGSLATGWKQINNKWYFFDYYSGVMTTTGCDTSPIGTAHQSYYAFDANGVWIQGNGWKKAGCGDYVYLKNSKCVTGWVKDNGKWYYLDPYYDAEMSRSYYVTDDEEAEAPYYMYTYVDGYYIDVNGVCRDGGYKWHKDKRGWWYGKGKYYEKSSTAYIDEYECTFDSEGYLMSTYSFRTGEYWIEYTTAEADPSEEPVG